MKLCSNNHEELCYVCYTCPLCAEKMMMVDEIKDLENTIEELEYEISRLETELNMAKQ